MYASVTYGHTVTDGYNNYFLVCSFFSQCFTRSTRGASQYRATTGLSPLTQPRTNTAKAVTVIQNIHEFFCHTSRTSKKDNNR